MIGNIIILAVILIVIIVFFWAVPVGLWISAIASGVSISMFNLIGMLLRRVRPSVIVLSLIKSTKAGLNLNITGAFMRELGKFRIKKYFDNTPE